MKKIMKVIIPIALICLIIGLVLLLIGSNITEKKVDLYDVNFDTFEFKKNQTYYYELEIIDDYFYSKATYNRYHRNGHNYYYNARLKNKYSDDIYVICELNDGARTNMIKDNNRIIKRHGVIKYANTKIKNKQLDSIDKNIDKSNIYSVYFVLSIKDTLSAVGIFTMLFSVILVCIIAPLSYLVNRKKIKEV